jgi:hypothetical protein
MTERSLSHFLLIGVRFFGPFHSPEAQSTVAESTDAIDAVVVSCWAPSFIELIELVARLVTSFLRNRISICAPSPLVSDNKGEVVLLFSSNFRVFLGIWIDGDLAVEHENWLSIPQVRLHGGPKRRRRPISRLGAHLTERCGYNQLGCSWYWDSLSRVFRGKK